MIPDCVNFGLHFLLCISISKMCGRTNGPDYAVNMLWKTVGIHNCDVSKKNNDTLKASTVLANEFSDQSKLYGKKIMDEIFTEGYFMN